jgi:2-oxoglutarate dehydrogenase E2 component (dihydrolipoamide succinyltransferase)
MGESIFEGTITKWLKKQGDTVEKDEPLFEISTDKVDAEIPSPAAGVLIEIREKEGATVEINKVVAVIAESGAGAGKSAVAPVAGEEKSFDKPAQSKTPAAPQVEGDGTDVVMPQMGESIFEGTITKWLKKAGDSVQKDEPLFEISTDKVDAEIPSPASGVLTEIKVPEGATVVINAVVAVIGGGKPAAAQPAGVPDAKVNAQSATQPSPETEARAAAAPSPASLPAPTAAATPEPQVSTGRLRSSPLVRRIAKEKELDLSRIAGTGSAGRITKDDVLQFLAHPQPVAPAPAQVAQEGPKAQQAPLPGGLVPMTRMRAIIAQRMLEASQTIPHAYSVYKIDMTRIVRLRERQKAGFEQRNGVKLTYMPFIAAAAIEALQKFPIVNASIEGTSIRYHQNIHIGIAVALEWGLIVPVIRQAEDRSFLGLARAVADLAARARAKKLKPEEASGSTFTLTNSGIFGGEFGTPIINQPESAILAIGGLAKEPVVLTDADGNDTIAIRSMQQFCLGFDHRTIDGADAGRFMSTFKTALETWDRELG